jgi:cytoskeletal protein CcmA (bactofilin family)
MVENSWNPESRSENHAATVSSAGTVTEPATIGTSVVIKGDVSGTEPLYIDGSVRGSINFPGHRVTVGRTSRIHAEIRAHDVVVMGSVEGNIYCSDLLDIRADSSIKGHMIAQRIRIDDGASLQGSVEVHSTKRSAEAEVVFHAVAAPAKPPVAAEASNPAEEFKAHLREAAAAVSVAGGGQTVKRVPGSHTLVEPTH